MTLTPAEHIVMDLLADHPDWTNDELAGALNRSVKRVEKMLTAAFRKYDVQSRTGAVVSHLARRRRKRDRIAKAETAEMGL